jgi:hypothetical protein
METNTKYRAVEILGEHDEECDVDKTVEIQEGNEVVEGKACKVCKEFKPLTNYHHSKSTKDKRRGDCTDCYKKYQAEYLKSLNGTFKKLLFSAKYGAKCRKEKGRNDAGIFDITQKDIEDQYEKQDGLCYYSGIKMNFDKNDWKMSIERLDTNKGYIKDNIVLCCLELNSKNQWSDNRIREMIQIIDNQVDDNDDIDFYTVPKPRKMKKIIKTIVNDIEHYNCTSCDKFFPISEFVNLPGIRNGCKSCRVLRQVNYCSSPRGTIKNLITHSKSNLKKKKDGRNLGFDIDFDFLVNLFNEQNGLCAYSGMPLCFGHDYMNTFWKISIERIDVMKGYLKDNVCFICLPFNGTDSTCMMKDKSLGNAGWNKEKFQYFLNAVRVKYAT